MANPTMLRRATDAAHHMNDPTPPWQDILTTARDVVGADGASLLMLDPGGNLLNLTQVGFAEAGEREYVAHYHAIDTVARDSMGVPAGVWMDTSEMYSAQESGRNEFFVDFLWRHKMQQVLAFMIETSPTLHAALSFQRATIDTKAKARLLQSDAAAYFRLLQVEMAKRQARVAAELASIERAFAALGDAVCLVSERGVVRWISTAARQFLEASGAIALRNGRLQHKHAAAQAAIERSLREAAKGGVLRRFTVPAAWGSVVTVDMARASDTYGMANETLVLVRLATRTVFQEPDVQQLELAFPITNAEARALAGLAKGHSVGDYAAASGVSEHTVRSHVATLMRKLQCNRQSELIKLALLVLR